jgi:hypothetical protein
VSVSKRSGKPTLYAGKPCCSRASDRRRRKERAKTAKRRCVTCKTLKPWSSFGDIKANRCEACRRQREKSPCRICGEPAGTTLRHGPRKTCSRPACRSAWMSRQRRKAAARQMKKAAALKTARCPCCGKTKRLAREFFSPNNLKPDGSIRWDSYCKMCRKAIAAERHRSIPEQRERTLAAQRRRRLKVRARRDADPAFDAQERRKRSEWDRQCRARRAQREEQDLEPSVSYPGGPEVPAGPLAAFVDREANHRQRSLNGHAPEVDVTIEHVCVELGIASRMVREWRRPNALARMDVLDRICTNAGVLWFDIFDAARFPAEHAVAARVFEGPARAR